MAGSTIVTTESTAAPTPNPATRASTRAGSAARETNSRKALALPSTWQRKSDRGRPSASPTPASSALCTRYTERICRAPAPRLLSTAISPASISTHWRETMKRNTASSAKIGACSTSSVTETRFPSCRKSRSTSVKLLTISTLPFCGKARRACSMTAM